MAVVNAPVTAPIHRASDMLPGRHPNDRQEVEVLTIEVRVNGRLIAEAEAMNESGLADFSDYRVTASETGYPAVGVPTIGEHWRIETHDRRQSSWALVERIAAAMRLFSTEARDG